MMAQSRAESTRDTCNYGQYINQFPQNTIKVIREFERIQKKICRHKMSIMFNEICINEEMLPKYTYIYVHIYIYTHTHTHTRIYIYIYTHVYIYIYIRSINFVIHQKTQNMPFILYMTQYEFSYIGSLAKWVECSPMIRETWVYSRVASYQ